MSTLDNNQSYFPPQLKTEKEKTEKWFKECADFGRGILGWTKNNAGSFNVRPSRRNKVINYNLRNDIIDNVEAERVTNPYRIDNSDFPNSYKNYPLLTPALNLLSGEERKRIFNPTATVINSDAITDKLQQIDEEFKKFYYEKISQLNFDPEQVKKEIVEFDKWRKYIFKDKRERMANQMLNYLYTVNDLAVEFSRGFEDLLIAGEEIYVIDIIGGEPVLRKGNPLNFYTIRNGQSYKIEDADVIVEDIYLPPSAVLDRYHDELQEKDIKYLESGHNIGSSGNSQMFSNQLGHAVGLNNIIPGVEIVDNWNDMYGSYNGAFDADGNVRVTRVCWRGKRQVGFITKLDEFGDVVKDMVPEQYKPNKELGEDVKWEWITEWYETTIVGSDLYLRMQPCPIQMRHMDNPSVCNPGIVGTVFNVNNNVGRSLFDEGRDLQYLYNFFMYRLEMAFTKYKGKIAKLPLHLVPDGWDVSRWLYYAEYLGWAVVDAFNESQKAAFRGKPAGVMNEGSPVIDLEMGNYIQNHIMMLDFIERRLESLTGITPQRKGAIDNRETVGGIERAVVQSSYITEKWFDVHDNTRKRALRALIEAAKIAWKDKSFVRQFTLDTGTIELLRFDYNDVRDIDVSVDVNNGSNDMQTLQALRQLGERFLQNNGSLSIIADLYRTRNVGDMQRKIETYEEDLIKRQQEEQQQQLQIQQQQMQIQENIEMQRMEFEAEQKALDRELKQYEVDTNNDTKIYTAELATYIKSGSIDANQNGIPDPMEIASQALKERKHASDVFYKDRELKLKEKDQSDKKDIESKRIELENKRLEIEYRKIKSSEKMQKMKDDEAFKREKLKARTAIKNKVVGQK
ncbi:MAG TPA: hypothetical protein PK957_03085 [Candidatus Dojkabacteria bacterium]|nr:hypothetical protein [Candidatus Dojkabacteria bacterium]